MSLSLSLSLSISLSLSLPLSLFLSLSLSFLTFVNVSRAATPSETAKGKNRLVRRPSIERRASSRL